MITVGGTTLTLGTGNTYGGETVWSGAGSGCSSVRRGAPAWQSFAHRLRRASAVSADVAADAEPEHRRRGLRHASGTRAALGWFQVGGTSLSSPLLDRAVYALAPGGSTRGTRSATRSGHGLPRR